MSCHRLFRSEEMCLYQMFMQYDNAYETTVALGELGLVEFLDLHLVGLYHTRQFTYEVEICDNISRRLEIMQNELTKENIKQKMPGTEPSAPYSNELFDTEKLQRELKGMSRNFYSTRRDYLKYTEYKQVMEATKALFDDKYAANDTMQRMIEDVTGIYSVNLIAGVVLREKVNSFEKVVWRICQGNVFFFHTPIAEKIEDPDTGNEVFKSVFYAVYQGEHIASKLLKVCEGFKATIYNCPNDPTERANIMIEIDSALVDLREILLEANMQRRSLLQIAAFNTLRWMIMIKKAKAVFHTMNKFQPDKMHKVFIAEFWIPKCNVNQLMSVLKANAAENSMVPVLVEIQTDEMPPTYHIINKVTTVFQELVDAYGANSYREHNPAPYYIITFPFLFSIMFGDMGHGILMSLAAIYMIHKEKEYEESEPSNEIVRIFFSGRYIILFMGLFAIYSGSLFNDIFSKDLHLFTPGWLINREHFPLEKLKVSFIVSLDPEKHFTGKTYPYGIDTAWILAKNVIIYKNSLKMKLSIIFGVLHMLFGLFLNLHNIMFFKKYSDIVTMLIPQILFLSSLFLYLVILIIFKWVAYGPNRSQEWGPGCAPSILDEFISMVLFAETVVNEGCNREFYPFQTIVQLILLGIAFLCIPWLFFAKPIVEIIEMRKKSRLPLYESDHQKYNTGYYDFCEQFGKNEGTPVKLNPRKSSLRFKTEYYSKEREIESKRFSSGRHSFCPSEKDMPDGQSITDIFIHQSVHTIEFFLGTVSNTASYLRLWALSLAHEQLSHVVWTQVLAVGLHQRNPFIQPLLLITVFFIWALLTIGILILMEGLSAFLHTLRLHWIEFQSKFYDGNGKSFAPFNFKKLIDISPN